ncbi:hypothetical protein MBGDN05_00766 [Thermoplasmatales archaeon SCGC AB-539-N05]|nr:hypothetical protein MBGDN05_00766 [Thermoplasmatales archaeon SCGC AB-539-N05]
MRKIAILLIVLMLIGVGFLSGCTETNVRDSRFVGEWKDIDIEYPQNTLTFFSDGTCLYSNLSSSWEIKDSNLVITTPTFGQEAKNTFSYVFSNNNQTLILTNVILLANYTLIKQ